MRRKKKGRRDFSVRRIYSIGMQEMQQNLYGKPALHMEYGGTTEIENCSGIVQYDPDRLKIDMKNGYVLIEGDGLCIDTYRKSGIRLHGRIFSVHFCEKEGTRG